MHYAQRIIVASLAGTIVGVACSESDNPSNPSTGPTFATAATFPCIGADTMGDKAPYNEQRVFLESQGWWGERKADGISVPKYGDAEHIHVGMCFPLKQTVSGVRKMIVKVMGHNLPVGSRIKSTGLHDPDTDTGPNINFASIPWNRTVLASDNKTITLWDTVDVDTRIVHDGLREFRNLTTIIRPPEPGQTVGAELHASSGWCWQIKNTSDAPVNSGTCATTPFSTMARGWYDCFEYKIAEVRNWSGTNTLTDYPWGGITRNADYTLKISGRDGAGDNNFVSGWEVRWDPDFHIGKLGTFIDSGSTSVTGRSVTIRAANVTGPKVHKLVIMGRANQKCTTATGAGIVPQDGEVSAVLAVPVKVK